MQTPELENIDFISESELDSLSKSDREYIEELSKACPRCGGASANKSNPSGRCRKHLNKLAHDKKKPGHWQRAQTKADDALRRQKGKNGTAHKKSKGLGTRDSIVKQTQSAEKKTGQKLSPDRVNNAHGYAAKNTRMVPEKLNRGRHKVDPKKLANWKKRLKKHNMEPEDFMTLLRAKAFEAGNESLEKSLNILDIERLLSHLPFKETEDEKLEKVQEEIDDLMKSLKDQVGTTHTIEVHPDVDNMLKAKNFIQ